MAGNNNSFGNDLLVSLRKIMQAVDLHSKDLKKKFGLTGPQLVILQQVAVNKQISVTDLARSVSLSQATVTDIVNRLAKNNFITKSRSETDKRRVMITPLQKCHEILEMAPPPLQETFAKQFSNLENWEKLMLLSALERIVQMMSAAEIDASPILATGPIDASQE